MANGKRCLVVHGHFYQPPRENPWTGKIDPQYSASPWENWNLRIADECYIPMARSRVANRCGETTDLYNNYAHTSFNFGPTLLSWLTEYHPELVQHLKDATAIDRTYAMAQAYNHMMMPLADARDRHTQILWGLREFNHRFGFFPKGMWLPECGIDSETVRALVDHGVEFVILSPHQASKARSFGDPEWRDVSMGAIDTRRAYRLFETDGGGRTHFDRYLDVIFYTPGLNLKVSFDHILTRPDDLARELESCFRKDGSETQLVSIVTDGEIYGHHEKHGEETLSRLFREIAPAVGLTVCSAGEFIRDNPPSWEVKLWNGEDGNGSSWSCKHGMGRWSRDCGCSPSTPPGWNQTWREPLRHTFDALRSGVRDIARRELGALVWDVDDAFNDYITILLEPGPAARAQFIKRHAQKELSLLDVEKLWRVLEALHNAMLMYTSCGWFFDELSGLEPVQNMRYALRAAELVGTYHDEDLTALLENGLARAKSNIAHFGDGGGVFRELAVPSRHSNRELAAAMAVCLASDFPADSLSWRLVDKTETVHYSDNNRSNVSWGSFVCLDERLDRFVKTSWVARLDDFDNSAIGIYGYEEIQGDPFRKPGDCPYRPDPDFSWLRQVETDTRKLTRQELLNRFGEFGVAHDRLPEAVRGMLYRRFSGEHEVELLNEVARLGAKAVPFLTRARRHGARVPESIVKTVTGAFEQEISQAVFASVADMAFDRTAVAAVERHRESARELGLHPDLDATARSLYLTAWEFVYWLTQLHRPGWFESLAPLTLPDGGAWLAPRCPANHAQTYPSAGGFSLALGKGLAKLYEKMATALEPRRVALDVLPLPEILSYAEGIGFDFPSFPILPIVYWDFLDKFLAPLIAGDAVESMAGTAGERVRETCRALRFADQAVDKRILEAMR